MTALSRKCFGFMFVGIGSGVEDSGFDLGFLGPCFGVIMEISWR